MGFHEFFVEGHAESRPVRDRDRSVDGLEFLGGQFVPQGKILDTILEQERVTTGAEPVQAGGDSQRARVGVVAQPGSDFFDAVGSFASLWRCRLDHIANDAEMMIEQLLSEHNRVNRS